MEPLVSIIIPCLNAAPWLADTFENCLKQTYSSIEIIFVDNGSTDGSWEIAKQFESPRIKLARCVRDGAGAARNEGLSLAKGKFIQHLDADDLLAPDKIQIQINTIMDHPHGTIASGAWSRFKNSPFEAVFKPEAVWRNCSPQEFLISSWLGGGMMPLYAWLVPSAVIAKAGRWNESLTVNDDGEFFTRVVLASSGVAFCPTAKGYYRTLPNESLSKRTGRKASESAYQACLLSNECLLRNSQSAAARSACAASLMRFAFAAYPTCPDLVAEAEAKAVLLGGSGLKPEGGRLFQSLSKLTGWKFARRLQAHRARLSGLKAKRLL